MNSQNQHLKGLEMIKTFTTLLCITVVGFFAAVANAQNSTCYDREVVWPALAASNYRLIFIGDFHDSNDGVLTYVNSDNLKWIQYFTYEDLLCYSSEGPSSRGQFNAWFESEEYQEHLKEQENE